MVRVWCSCFSQWFTLSLLRTKFRTDSFCVVFHRHFVHRKSTFSPEKVILRAWDKGSSVAIKKPVGFIALLTLHWKTSYKESALDKKCYIYWMKIFKKHCKVLYMWVNRDLYFSLFMIVIWCAKVLSNEE